MGDRLGGGGKRRSVNKDIIIVYYCIWRARLLSATHNLALVERGSVVVTWGEYTVIGLYFPPTAAWRTSRSSLTPSELRYDGGGTERGARGGPGGVTHALLQVRGVGPHAPSVPSVRRQGELFPQVRAARYARRPAGPTAIGWEVTVASLRRRRKKPLGPGPPQWLRAKLQRSSLWRRTGRSL